MFGPPQKNMMGVIGLLEETLELLEQDLQVAVHRPLDFLLEVAYLENIL